jgi:hypothetical protein
MKKTKTSAQQPLATFWMPPNDDVGAPISCIATTYTFHAALFEDELLPRFLKLKFDSTEKEKVFIAEREDKLATVTAAVFVDATHVDGRQTTGRWSQVPVRVPRGCQHSKVSCLIWEHHIRIIIASANLTTTGYRRNREIAACLDFFDGANSASKELFGEIVAFIDKDVLLWSSMPDGTRSRLKDALEDARTRAKRWKLPEASSALPVTRFIPVAPKRDGAPARGVIAPMLEEWGARSVDHLYVMTPFIGDSEQAVRDSIDALQQVRRARGSEAHLILGGRQSETDEDKFTVDQPSWFRDVWCKAWKLNEPSLYVVPPQREGERVERALHAKGIAFHSSERSLVMVGSSNFSPHGLGLKVHNLEANLCYTVKEKEHEDVVWGAFPVIWSADQGEGAIWPEEAATLADELESTQPPLPHVFEWVTFDERTGALSVKLSSAPLPLTWSIEVPGRNSAVFDSTIDSLTLVDGVLVLMLADFATAHRITYVIVHWTDNDGAHTARLPTLLDHEAELLPPLQLRNLRTDDIVSCILSGKDPQ